MIADFIDNFRENMSRSSFSSSQKKGVIKGGASGSLRFADKSQFEILSPFTDSMLSGMRPPTPSAAQSIQAADVLPIEFLENQHGQVKAWVTELVFIRIAISQIALFFELIATAVKILLSAVGDVRWGIGIIHKDMKGRELTSFQKEVIGSLCALEEMVFQHIRRALGIHLTDEQMRALTQQKFSGNKANHVGTAEQTAQSNDGNFVNPMIETIRSIQSDFQAEADLKMGFGDTSKGQPILKGALNILRKHIQQILQEVIALLAGTQNQLEPLLRVIGRVFKLLDRADGMAALENGSIDSYNLGRSGGNSEVDQMREFAQTTLDNALSKIPESNNPAVGFQQQRFLDMQSTGYLSPAPM